VKTYSGGMIRRLELAQALVNAPRLLVLDEPTVGLDPIARADVWEFIAGLRQSSHTTVVMTTHYMEEADLHCDRVALMHHGTLRATGTSAELKAGLGEGATLDDVFRHYTGGTLDDESEQGGILAQSTLFIAIFYGIQIIWERDAGVLAKLMVTPTPRAALITGKAFAAGVRSIAQAVVIVVLSALLGVALTLNPLKLLGVAVIVVLGSAFFSCLSMSIAGIALSRDRLMGIGQAITMPLFFSSNALYPERLMPGWLQAISKVNPLSYEVSALRWLLIGIPTNLALDTGVLVGATVAGITVASLLLPRLAR
jgi:ABC-2 type transport system permease protein